jgi:secreted PhoX family phosphatase
VNIHLAHHPSNVRLVSTCSSEIDGPLLRFKPDEGNVSTALASGNWTNFLKAPPSSTDPATTGPGAKWEYLLLTYNSNKSGTFSWTSSISSAWQNAYTYYKNIEGVDVHNGRLYMTAKLNKQLFILDLDQKTFVESSTVSGAFTDQPDQVARLVDNDGILYFCEDGSSGSGVHGRNPAGQYFTILQADNNNVTNGGVIMTGETTGLALSPDNMFMYVSYQEMGKIIELRRADGLPFNGMRLDIKYHSV